MSITIKKNIPDRIKLVLQFIVFSLGLWLLLMLLLMFSGLPVYFKKNIDFGLVLYSLLPVSIIIQLIRLISKWKKLIESEKLEQFPDLQNINNMTSFQSVFILIGILLLVSGVSLFALYSKLAGVLCIIVYMLLWGYDLIYQKKRIQNIESDKHKSHDSQ